MRIDNWYSVVTRAESESSDEKSTQDCVLFSTQYNMLGIDNKCSIRKLSSGSLGGFLTKVATVPV